MIHYPYHPLRSIGTLSLNNDLKMVLPEERLQRKVIRKISDQKDPLTSLH